MIVLWVVYSLVTGGLLLLAAVAADGCARTLRFPRRWIWGAALTATLGLAASSAYRAAWPEPTMQPKVTSIPAGLSSEAAPAGVHPVLAGAATVVRAMLDAPLAVVQRTVDSSIVRGAGRVLVLASIVTSALLAAAFLLTLLRHRRERRRWPERLVAGERVRVAPSTGPAVMGVLRPEIVVPSWLLRATADEQAMVITHEREHLRARDNLTLAFAGLAVALLPWHPCVWWMAARLRLAVEMDCDARVIRAGTPPRRYGAVLIDMATRRTGMPLGGVALIESSSQLERRLRAMTEHAQRRVLVRTGVLAASAIVLVLGACEAELPTAAELDAMDVAAIEEELPLARQSGEPVYRIDGVLSDAAAAHALAPDEIASIAVMKQPLRTDGVVEAPVISIETRRAAVRHRADAAADSEMPVRMRPLMKSGSAAPVETETPVHVRPLMTQPGSGVPAEDERFTGLLYIDGEAADHSALRRLDHDEIERVEVVKGAAAVRLYADPAASRGVIQVFTKKGAGSPPR